MFDIGFWELSLAGLIALLVVGPERFPKLIKTLAGWVRRVRGVASNLRTELESHVDTDSLKQTLSEQADQMRDLQEEMKRAREQISELTQGDAPSNTSTSDDRT